MGLTARVTNSADGVVVSARAECELLHAEVAVLLSRAGIPVLHIKGPTVARWLYPAGGRRWGDVDVLVPRRRTDEALAVLTAHGFVESTAGLNHRTSEDHAVVLLRGLDAGGGEVDLHHRFPGIEVAPDRGFDVLWSHRVADSLGGVTVWFPGPASRAVLVALNTARSGRSSQARRDLELLASGEGAVDWADVAALAAELGAVPAVRAGLELCEAGARVVSEEPRLSAVPVSPEWRLRLGDAPRTALRLEELRALAPAQRVVQLARWLVPHPAVLRYRDPRAADGHASSMLRAYGRRWRDGARSVPASLRALRQARRR